MKKFNSAIARVRNSAGEFEALPALRGLDSYQLAVQNGFEGTEEEWMNSIIGDGWVGAYQQLEAEQKTIKTEQEAIKTEQTDIKNAQSSMQETIDGLASEIDGITPESIGAASLNEDSKVNVAQTSAGINVTGISITLGLSNAGKFIWSSAEEPITITIPANTSVAFPIDTEIEICQGGGGAVTIGAESGVALLSLDGSRTIAGPYGVVCLKKVNTDNWILAGALE